MRQRTAAFEPIEISGIASLWLNRIHPHRFIYLAETAMMAVMRGLDLPQPAAERALAGAPLFVPSTQDRYFDVLNPDIPQPEEQQKRIWLATGTVALGLIRGAEALLRNPISSRIEHAGDPREAKKLLVKGTTKRQCIKAMERPGMGVTSLAVRWLPHPEGLIDQVAISARITGGAEDYYSVSLAAVPPRPFESTVGLGVTGFDVRDGIPDISNQGMQAAECIARGLQVATAP